MVWIFETLAEIGIPDVVERWRQEERENAARTMKPAMRATNESDGGILSGPTI
jgi:hypothetical protein